jgi:phosphoribosyl 1,2-cyclic phosphodiesterase
MEDHFRGCDYLIMNVLRPRTDSWPGHMNSEGAVKLINGSEPKTPVIKHFGMKMLRGVAYKEAEWMRKQTGTRVVVARDGLVIKDSAAARNEKTLEKYL